GRWFFRHFSTETGIEEYVFVITALFISAFFSHLVGFEPIIGAFLAGLTLNSLIPEKSTLMNRIQFVGNSLFIPFFLVSVGMLIDPSTLLTDINALKVAVAMVIIAILSKYIAAHIFGKMVKFSKIERELIFGMSVNQAAATLAAVMVGLRLGIFNEAILTGTIVMIFVTCFMGSILTQKYGRNLLKHSKDILDLSKEDKIDRILLPVKNIANLNNLMSLAFLLHLRTSHEPLYLLHIVIGGENEEVQVIEGENLLTKAVVMANAAQKQVIPLTKIDLNVSSAILKAVSEQRITKIILGWNEPKNFTYTFFDTIMEQLVKSCNQMIFIPRIVQPLNITKKIFLILPPLINRQQGFRKNIFSLKEFFMSLSAKIVIISEEKTAIEVREHFKEAGISPEFVNVYSWKKISDRLREVVKENDMIMQLVSRKGKPAWRSIFDRMPYQLKQNFPDNNLMVVYPYFSVDDVEFEKEYFTQQPTLLRTIPEKNFFFNLKDNHPHKVFKKIVSINRYLNSSVIYNDLISVLNEYPIELTPEITLIHKRTDQISDYQLFFAVNRNGFMIKDMESKPKIIITLLSPTNQTPQSHLNILSEISRMVLLNKFIDNILAADNYLHFLELYGQQRN
ncbi:MAG TPA: sodium/hydrogen exchanger, partial [Firmicutes bacterium]|nr:sodium/hydrogen exchanger [Bacillota bacterium]